MVSNIPPLIIILEVNLINQTSALNPDWKGAESLPVNQHQLTEKTHVQKMIQDLRPAALSHHLHIWLELNKNFSIIIVSKYESVNMKCKENKKQTFDLLSIFLFNSISHDLFKNS